MTTLRDRLRAAIEADERYQEAIDAVRCLEPERSDKAQAEHDAAWGERNIAWDALVPGPAVILFREVLAELDRLAEKAGERGAATARRDYKARAEYHIKWETVTAASAKEAAIEWAIEHGPDFERGDDPLWDLETFVLVREAGSRKSKVYAVTQRMTTEYDVREVGDA